MTPSSNFVLTLTLVAVTCCYALAKPTSADSRFLSLFSPRLLPRLSSISYSDNNNFPPSSGPFSSQGENMDDDVFNQNGDDVNSLMDPDVSGDENESFAALSSPLLHNQRGSAYYLPSDFLQLGTAPASSGSMRRDSWVGDAAHDSGLMMGRGKRFIPGLNDLLVARLFNNDNDLSRSDIIEGLKGKRKPHEGFHASRG